MRGLGLRGEVWTGNADLCGGQQWGSVTEVSKGTKSPRENEGHGEVREGGQVGFQSKSLLSKYLVIFMVLSLEGRFRDFQKCLVMRKPKRSKTPNLPLPRPLSLTLSLPLTLPLTLSRLCLCLCL